MRRTALIAVVPLLAFAAGCTSEPDTAPAGKPTPAAGTAPDNSAGTGKGTAKGTGTSAEPGTLPGVTADQLAAHQQVAACMKQQGVTVADPVVGQPFDTSEMNRLFSADRAKWDAVLANCDYKKVVIGVG